MIPFHIQIIGKLYPISKSFQNFSKGEIEKFNWHQDFKNKHKIGEYISDMNGTWVHLGNDYFKCIFNNGY